MGDFEVAWLDAEGEHRAQLPDVASVVEFARVQPVRPFPSYRGQRHFPGLYWAATTGAHVGFESWLERDHAILLDFAPEVTGFASQPFWLFWPAAKRVRSHAPDYFARIEDGRGLVIDCRPVERIDDRSAESFAAMEAACEAVGWGYRLVGAVDPVRMANVRWLAGYRHPRHGASADLTAAVLSAFEAPSALVGQAELVGELLEVLPAVFHLLWRGRLTADLSRPLTDTTLVTRVRGR
ncbi:MULTISPECIES: TnsA-like heteromeric transposase endonuclease subunit [unclassified Kitasatospora]|uniref:TnsA-like heteromeric transposase endonuclease subunit n=1 Tax=unclassified Kitasatospora TaxID=2633591 RepID=UPI00247425CA|nr:TnsA-like heteromeric transposase endonuclease subunit [Kitasatospora sp. MAP12-44]